MLIPITVAWFTGGAWYMAKHTSFGHFPGPAASSPPKVVEVIHLGPTNTANENGRPVAATDRVSGQPMGEPKDVVPELIVRFAKNTQELALSDEELRWCDSAREHLGTQPRAMITVTGHTDGDGDPQLNERLSLHRAEMVRARLIELGVPADRIVAVGMGAKEHISEDRSSKGKATNRRVEIRLIERP